MKACGVCGADLNFLRIDEQGYTLQSGRCSLPLVIGHEFSGEVLEVGKDVKELRVGDMVVAVTDIWCGECPACRAGMFNQCLYEKELGFTIPGGFAEYLDLKGSFRRSSLFV